MFRGPAALMKRNPLIWWASGVSVAACVLGVLAPLLLSGISKGVMYAGLVLPMVILYPVLLSVGLKPKFTRVDLYVDQNGVWADDAPLITARGKLFIDPGSYQPAAAILTALGFPVMHGQPFRLSLFQRRS
jgi:hypothetical protein